MRGVAVVLVEDFRQTLKVIHRMDDQKLMRSMHASKKLFPWRREKASSYNHHQSSYTRWSYELPNNITNGILTFNFSYMKLWVVRLYFLLEILWIKYFLIYPLFMYFIRQNWFKKVVWLFPTYEMVDKLNHELFQKLINMSEMTFPSIDNSRSRLGCSITLCISEHT